MIFFCIVSSILIAFYYLFVKKRLMIIAVEKCVMSKETVNDGDYPYNDEKDTTSRNVLNDIIIKCKDGDYIGKLKERKLLRSMQYRNIPFEKDIIDVIGIIPTLDWSFMLRTGSIDYLVFCFDAMKILIFDLESESNNTYGINVESEITEHTGRTFFIDMPQYISLMSMYKISYFSLTFLILLMICGY